METAQRAGQRERRTLLNIHQRPCGGMQAAPDANECGRCGPEVGLSHAEVLCLGQKCGWV